MTSEELMNKVIAILDEVKTGVLTTIGDDGYPRGRWMSPIVLSSDDNTLYTITAPDFKKIEQLEKNPHICWLIQTASLEEIVHITGKINIIDNPALKAEIMERIGRRLHAFWKLRGDETLFIVLETVIEEATYFLPMRGHKEIVKF